MLPKLKECWRMGLTVFQYFRELSITKDSGEALTNTEREFVRKNKAAIICEIERINSGTRINAEDFYGPALMSDAAARARKEVQQI